MPALEQATLHINLTAIPDFRREELAKGALELMEQVFSVPGAEERYQAWLKERKAKQKRGGRGRSVRKRSATNKTDP